jgi:hypothetical protein
MQDEFGERVTATLIIFKLSGLFTAIFQRSRIR